MATSALNPRTWPRTWIERLAFLKKALAENAKAVNASAGYGIDDVIDPADTRSWLVMGLNSVPPTPERTTKKYPYIDPW